MNNKAQELAKLIAEFSKIQHLYPPVYRVLANAFYQWECEANAQCLKIDKKNAELGYINTHKQIPYPAVPSWIGEAVKIFSDLLKKESNG